MGDLDTKQASPTPSVFIESHPHNKSSSADAALPTLSSGTKDIERGPTGPSTGLALYRARYHAHPRPFLILAGLILLLVVTIVGLVLYMTMVPNAYEGAMAIVNALFILL